MKGICRLRAVPDLRGAGLHLRWQNPLQDSFSVAKPFTGIRILRAERTFPELSDSGDVFIGEEIYSGTVVSSFLDQGLRPQTVYYYVVYTVEKDTPPKCYADDHSRVAALSTSDYLLTERLYRMLPSVHLRNDRLSPADLSQYSPEVRAALASLPPELRDQGPLRRFIGVTAAPLDVLRSTAEALRQLHDVDLTRPEYLQPLAQWIGWETDRSAPVYAQRNEIRNASYLYRSVGTIPNIRALVTRYTGWYTQVAEFIQNLAQANSPPQRNIFSIVADADGWPGGDDAASVLGFGPANSTAQGADRPPPAIPDPATLVGSTAEPFSLRSGMEFTVLVDERIPATVRFMPGDFQDIGAASAAELASVLNRELSELTVTVVGGRLAVRSSTRGRRSSLSVMRQTSSLVTLEGAPQGRLSAFDDPSKRLRLFYEVTDPLGLVHAMAARDALLAAHSLETTPVSASSRPAEMAAQPFSIGQIRYKTFRNGTWSESFSLTAPWSAPQGAPTSVMLDSSRVFVAWIESPHTAQSVVRFVMGRVRLGQPAQLVGQRCGPFSIGPGSRLLLWGNWPDPETFEFMPGEVPRSASAAEVAAALNTRLVHVKARAQPDNTITLTASAGGGYLPLEARLGIDLRHSTAAEELGFDARNAIARGDWGDEIDFEWSEKSKHLVAAIPAGRLADLYALRVGKELWLFYAMHSQGLWRIALARWDGVTWSNDDLGLSKLPRQGDGSREPSAAIDGKGTLWLVWAQFDAQPIGGDHWTLRARAFDPLTATWSPDVKKVTESPLGTVSADREPSVISLPSGELQIFFSSTRDTGGSRLFSVLLSGGIPGRVLAVTQGAASDLAPTPVFWDGKLAVLFRSDRNLALSKVATQQFRSKDVRLNYPAAESDQPPCGLPLSFLLPDSGTLRRFGGTTSAQNADIPRMGRRRRWDDLLSYTSQDPSGPALTDDDLYTRGTVGLFLSQLVPDGPLAQKRIDRLRPVLRSILPINVRAVVVLAPRVDIDYVFGPEADGTREPQDGFSDHHPFLEFYTGVTERSSVKLPDWSPLLSNTLGNLSADPTDLTTLRKRTYYPPPT